MKKFVFAMVCSLTLAGFVVADEFTALITNVSGNNITYFKTKADPDAKGGGKGGKGGGKGGGKAMVKDGDAVKGKVDAKAKIVTGTYNKDDMKFVAGDAIEGGLTADTFKSASDEKGVSVMLTTASDGTITQIMTTGGKGGGKGGKKKGG